MKYNSYTHPQEFLEEFIDVKTNNSGITIVKTQIGEFCDTILLTYADNESKPYTELAGVAGLKTYRSLDVYIDWKGKGNLGNCVQHAHFLKLFSKLPDFNPDNYLYLYISKSGGDSIVKKASVVHSREKSTKVFFASLWSLFNCIREIYYPEV